MLRGYDATAYFTKRSPAAGAAAHTVTWNGVVWRFATAADAAKFRANPAAFEPQFGGHCTGGLSQHHVVDASPLHWRVHGNKLYLFATSAGGRRFDADPQGVIARATAYWNSLGPKR